MVRSMVDDPDLGTSFIEQFHPDAANTVVKSRKVKSMKLDGEVIKAAIINLFSTSKLQQMEANLGSANEKSLLERYYYMDEVKT